MQDPTPFTRNPFYTIKTSRMEILSIVFLILGLNWWTGSYRDPVEIIDCLNRENPGTPQFKCLESKTLKIPRAYYGDGYQFNVGNRPNETISHLEVAYPGMRPWQSIPWGERKGTQKNRVVITWDFKSSFGW